MGNINFFRGNYSDPVREKEILKKYERSRSDSNYYEKNNSEGNPYGYKSKPHCQGKGSISGEGRVQDRDAFENKLDSNTRNKYSKRISSYINLDHLSPREAALRAKADLENGLIK